VPHVKTKGMGQIKCTAALTAKRYDVARIPHKQFSILLSTALPKFIHVSA
jgi:hypothetical protein